MVRLCSSKKTTDHNWSSFVGMVFQLFVLVTLFGGAKSEKSDDCDSSKMMTTCLVSMSESTEKERLFFPDTQEKLKSYCSHLMKGLECTNQLMEKCSTENERKLYKNLTLEMVGTNVALCTEGSPMSAKFLKHVNCYKQLSGKFQRCSDRFIDNTVVVHGLSQEEQVILTCCTVYEYSRCMRNVVAGKCEPEAVELVEDTVIRALNNTKQYCMSQLNQDLPTENCRKLYSPSVPNQSSNLDYDEEAKNCAYVNQFPFFILLTVLVRSLLFR